MENGGIVEIEGALEDVSLLALMRNLEREACTQGVKGRQRQKEKTFRLNNRKT